MLEQFFIFRQHFRVAISFLVGEQTSMTILPFSKATKIVTSLELAQTSVCHCFRDKTWSCY